MTKQEAETKIKRAIELRRELFDIANSFGDHKFSEVVVALQASCNSILWAKELVESGVWDSVICPECGQTIDPEVCWCGDYIKDHNPWFCGHSAIPMGCDCGRNKQSNVEENPV